MDAARAQEESLHAQNEELKKTLDLMQQIKQVESDIAANRKEFSAGELAELVTAARAPSIAPDDTPPAFRNLIPDDPIEIPLAIPPDAVQDARDMAARAAEAARDEMSRFTDDVPDRFEENMHRAFHAVRDFAGAFGARASRIMSNIFGVASGGARLSRLAGGQDGVGELSPLLGKMGKQIGAVAEAVTPIAGALGGMVGVMKGLSSLFGGNEMRRQAGNVLNPENPITIEGLQRSIEALDEWLDEVRPLVEEGRASEVVENQYWLNLRRRGELESKLEGLLAARDGGGSDDEQGKITYTTTITITDATAKDLISKISTNSTLIGTLNTAISNLDRTIKAWSPGSGQVQVSDIITADELAAIKGLLDYDLLSADERAVIDALIADRVLIPEEIEILRRLADYDLLPEDARAVIQSIVADGIITTDEMSALQRLLDYDLLSADERAVIDALIADRVLTPDEMEILRRLADYDLLPEAAKAAIRSIVADGIITAEEMTTLQRLLAGDIPPIEIADPPVIPVELPSQEAVAAVFGQALADAIAQNSGNLLGGIGSVGDLSGLDFIGSLGGGKTDGPSRSQGLR